MLETQALFRKLDQSLFASLETNATTKVGTKD